MAFCGGNMETITKKVSELIPYINNPRNNDDAVDAVASSIKNFGFKVPIVVDSNNEIINGHTRLKAAQKLGLETVPVIVAYDLTPEQVKAFRLADNKVAEFSTWDEDKLNEELEGIRSELSDGWFYVEPEKKEEKQEQTESPGGQYVVAITTDTEKDQINLYDELVADGYNVKVVNI